MPTHPRGQISPYSWDQFPSTLLLCVFHSLFWHSYIPITSSRIQIYPFITLNSTASIHLPLNHQCHACHSPLQYVYPSKAILTHSVEHPFLRADNRHFVFYIWRRTIKRHYLAKYIAVPIYYTSTWLVVRTLAYSQSALFVLGMVTCTALTIVPSPLLEFRYFVLPYLLWRLHLSPLTLRDKWRGVMEYIWFEVINVVTLWLFVTRPFEWPSEPGKVQRFIW